MVPHTMSILQAYQVDVCRTSTGCNRGSNSVGPGARLFQPLLFCTKEGRQSMTHSGPASSEPLPLQREVQHVDVEDYYVPDSSGRLVRYCRPETCLFSHSGCPAAQEVPSVCFWREGLPLLGSSWRRGRSKNSWMLLWPL